MKIDRIPFKNTGYFSKVIVDYLDGNSKIKSFYKYSPELSQFSEAIENKRFSKGNRSVLTNALTEQYKTDGIKLNRFKSVFNSIELLNAETTYTVTTGHQLNLFTGPLYFLFKIASTIKLAKTLKNLHPNKDFIPIYWMATEDHDFEEINHFNFNGNKYEWKTEQTGAVGRMNLGGLDNVFNLFSAEFSEYSSHGVRIKQLFETAYTKHENLASATRYIANELFSEYGLVIIDGDDVNLKQVFSSIVTQELINEFSSKEVEKTNKELSKEYKIQVNPREINLFYLKNDLRARIVRVGDEYLINETEIKFSEAEILKELETNPERFSPNVILRPVYQETILPNLAYIGGGGELAYWFQLKSTFEKVDIPFPILVLRNSAMYLDEKQEKYYNSLGLNLNQLFKAEGILAKEWTIQNSKDDLKLADELSLIDAQFKMIAEKANSVDSSLKSHVEALAKKQQNVLKDLSEKLIRVERKKQTLATNQISHLKKTLFPNGGLQERKENFSVIYLTKGQAMIEELIDSFEVPTTDFYIFK